MNSRRVQDLQHLPTWGHGHRSITWWGTLGFITLEGTGFALAAAAYLYLAWLNTQWPLSARPPDLIWSSLITITLVASLLPIYITKANAEKEDLPRVRRDLVIMSLIGLLVVGIRGFEFTTLNVNWDTNAYGSLVWVPLGLHTAHLLTDFGDTLVLTALMFTRKGRGRRFSDVGDNAFYWYFVVLAWLPIYGLIYWFP